MSPHYKNESTLIDNSRYFGDAEYEHALQQYNSKTSILCISAKDLTKNLTNFNYFLTM